MARQVAPSENSRRALYNHLKQKPGYQDKVITDSYLLLQASIQATPTVVKFPVLTNETVNSIPTSAVEVRLDITDRFCAFDWALMLRKAGTSATVLPTNAEMAYSIPRSYPNPATGAFVGTNEARNLEAIYNGNLKVTIDSDVYYQAYPCRNFYRVPVSQKGTTSAAIAGPVLYPIADDGWDSMNYAFATITPNFEFSGIGKNVVELTIPSPTSLIGTSSWNFVDLIVRGFLIQNVNQKR